MQKQDSRDMGMKQPANTLRQLYAAGQSPWYDNVERRLFKNGEFQRLINEYGIVGVTSNPTIFDKAISSSNDYDEAIRKLVKDGKSVSEIYDALTTEDIATAADMLLDTYKATKGIDGYVSIEVLPDYAYDPKKTVEYARKLFKELNRKNILIKVPGTREGLPAIRQLIADGINVNVTLLFSVAHYEAVAKAYIDGLKDRLNKKQKLGDVTSVASVFISRIDTKIDKMLEEKNAARLCGKAAVANSKIIYRRFKDIFWSKDFEGLKKNGANIQRALWASTSTKNPGYRDVKYVEELIGPDTINTMPHQTVIAFHDHGVVNSNIGQGPDEAKKIRGELRSFGIDINDVCENLQKEGVKAFIDSFNSLIGSIGKKARSLQG
ncbi:MAG: transaldolase [Candidatus Omnitrophica bacterium]|nr:transaldolase [Candidatus Omnitrophota bacterium]